METSHYQITINGVAFDIDDGRLAGQDTEHVLIKLIKGFNHTVCAVLEDLGVDMQEDMGHDIWLCHFPGKDKAKVEAEDFVGFVIEYPSFIKIGSELKNVQGFRNVDIALHQDAYSRTNEICEDVQNLSPTAEVSIAGGNAIFATIAAEHLPRISELDSIKSIELTRVIQISKHTTHWALLWDFYEHPEEAKARFIER